MYQIRCDDLILYDPRDDERKLLNPKCKLEVNKVGEGSFTILPTHPSYGFLKKLKSVFEIRQNDKPIFRGRMTDDKRDFHNRLTVELECVLGYTNDSIIPPFNFPDDFDDVDTADNVVEYFLRWILTQHNNQVESWQQLKLGNVTVTDPNNYITRSSTAYASTWDTLKSKLFNSALGGYLMIRYEDDGNYVDYLQDLTLTNTQRVTFGENILDITNASDASSTCSAILPLGAETENADGTKSALTLRDLPDGDLTDDLVLKDVFIYSKSALEQYGWVCVPIADSKWTDVTDVDNLKTKAIEYLTGTGLMLSGTTTIKAVDLHFTDEQIQSFRIGRNVIVDSPVHGVVGEVYGLTALTIDILNPQNTTITIGDTKKTLIDINSQTQSDNTNRIEIAEKDIEENRTHVSEVKNQVVTLNTQMINDCERIILSALEGYVETSNYEEYKETIETQLQIMAGEILMNFTTTTEQVTNVDGDLQAKFTELYKYISFSGGDIVLGSSANGITLTIQNDLIVFKRNGVQFGSWDGNNFYTGNIVVQVNERAQFGNFAYVPRSDGSLSFLKVGG